MKRKLLLLLGLVITTLGLALPVSQSASAYGPNLWIGSPVVGYWNANPANHARFVKAQPRSDWAVDITTRNPNQQVKVYASTSNGAIDSQLRAVVTQVVQDTACRVGGGGDLVTVSFYQGGTPLGSVVYGHIQTTLRAGASVNRWGGSVGTVATGLPTSSACWTGPHVHMELRAHRDYACWNKGFGIGSGLAPSNFVGFIAGTQLARQARPCP